MHGMRYRDILQSLFQPKECVLFVERNKRNNTPINETLP